MKKITFLLLAAVLMLGACANQNEDKQGSDAASATSGKASVTNTTSTSEPPAAPQELLDRESAKKPTGDVAKDAADLFEAIKVLTIDHKSDEGAAQAQKLSEEYSVYYRKMGKLNEFKQKLTEVTVASAEAEKARRAKEKEQSK